MNVVNAKSKSSRCFLVLFALCTIGGGAVARAAPLTEQNEALFQRIKEVHNLSDEQMAKLVELFKASGYMSQGNPSVTKHPMTREQCVDKVKNSGVLTPNPEWEKICGAKFMAPLYDPSKEKPEDAKTCIDIFEFPNIPCEYPVVWVKAKEAEEICEAEGKRLCDAHEWEGACAGALEAPDYDFKLAQGKSDGDAFRALRAAHNRKFAVNRSWSYGPKFQKGVCAQDSTKTEGCNGGNWEHCGSNTYPTGSFPDCKSGLGVYDLNGNAAEHMNMPLKEADMTSRGSKTLGQTEMKGSWFIFDKFQAHEDWCRWRAPYWHGSRVMDDHSHHNYHLSFRCCSGITAPLPPPPAPAAEPASAPATQKAVPTPIGTPDSAPAAPIAPATPAAPETPAAADAPTAAPSNAQPETMTAPETPAAVTVPAAPTETKLDATPAAPPKVDAPQRTEATLPAAAPASTPKDDAGFVEPSASGDQPKP